MISGRSGILDAFCSSSASGSMVTSLKMASRMTYVGFMLHPRSSVMVPSTITICMVADRRYTT